MQMSYLLVVLFYKDLYFKETWLTFIFYFISLLIVINFAIVIIILRTFLMLLTDWVSCGKLLLYYVGKLF